MKLAVLLAITCIASQAALVKGEGLKQCGCPNLREVTTATPFDCVPQQDTENFVATVSGLSYVFKRFDASISRDDARAISLDEARAYCTYIGANLATVFSFDAGNDMVNAARLAGAPTIEYWIDGRTSVEITTNLEVLQLGDDSGLKCRYWSEQDATWFVTSSECLTLRPGCVCTSEKPLCPVSAM